MISVLQIIPSLAAGGAERACVDVAIGLARRGDRSFVVSSGGRMVAELETGGAAHITRDAKTKNPAKILKNALWLADFIRREKIDVLHARSRAPAWSAWLACRMTGCRFVTTFHAAYKFSNPAKKLYNGVMAKGWRIIAISRFIAKHIADEYGVGEETIRLVYRGIDLEKFDPAKINPASRRTTRREWGVMEDCRIVLLPARLTPIKGHSLLIEALSLMPKEFADVHAVIVGDDQRGGGYRLELERLAKDRGVGDRVRLLRHSSDMPAAYAAADVVAVPSLVAEGFGRTPVEAMAMGVPVIASDLGAVGETVLDGETGWLLPPENPVLWRDAMVRALSMKIEEKNALAAAAIARVKARFDNRDMVEKTIAVYDEAKP